MEYNLTQVRFQEPVEGQKCPESLIDQISTDEPVQKETAMYLHKKVEEYLDCYDAETNMAIVLDIVFVMIMLALISISLLQVAHLLNEFI